MIRITREISREEYEALDKMNYKEQEERLFPDGIPLDWACGYGYYGHQVWNLDGEYHVTYSIGDSCD